MKEKIVEEVVKELEVKTFDKITIKDVTKKLDISRQTFYYYFKDLYEVIELIFGNASKFILNCYDDITNWKFGYLSILHWIESNKKMIANTYKTIEREYINTFLYELIYPYIENIVKNSSENVKIRKEDKDFISKFITLSFIAITTDWIKNGMIETPEELANKVSILMGDYIKNIVKNFENYNKENHLIDTIFV